MMCCLSWQATHYLCISIEKHKRSSAFLNNNNKKNSSSYGGPMRLSYSFYRPSALGHRPGCCPFLAFFSRKKKNQPSLFHDPDCKFDKLSREAQINSICHRLNIFLKKYIILKFFLKSNYKFYRSFELDQSNRLDHIKIIIIWFNLKHVLDKKIMSWGFKNNFMSMI